jgi:hypothetical protein
MFGKAWDELWHSFGVTMSKLEPAIKEATSRFEVAGCQVEVGNGRVYLKGKFKSIHINGRLLRIPREVLEGE